MTAPLPLLPAPSAGFAAGGRKPALLAVGHGSRDARHAAAMRRLAEAITAARPGLRMEVGFLDLCAPDVPGALGALVASGATAVAVLPLFLAHGYHVRHDVPRAVAGALAEIRAWRGGWTPDVTFCDPLGPDPLLSEAMDARLRAAGVWPTDPRLGLIVASAGSSDSSALAQVEAVARSWGGADNAYAAAAPTTAQAIARLRARGREDVAVASYFLAPGRLPDRVHADCVEAGVPFGGPLLTPDSEPPDELVRLVLARYASAAFLPSAGNLAA